MNRLGLTLVLPPATLFLCATLRAAEAPATPPAGNSTVSVQRVPENAPLPGRMTAEDILKRFDKNGDGKLDEDEAAAAHEAVMQEQIQQQEARAAALKGTQVPPRLLEQFDKNHDGKLDEEERAEMRKYFSEHGQPGGPGGVPGPAAAIRQEILRRFDQNHDRRIDDAEWERLSPMLRERMNATLRQLLRYDKNGDGVIDENEWAEATAEIRQWLNETPPLPAGANPAAAKPATAAK